MTDQTNELLATMAGVMRAGASPSQAATALRATHPDATPEERAKAAAYFSSFEAYEQSAIQQTEGDDHGR